MGFGLGCTGATALYGATFGRRRRRKNAHISAMIPIPPIAALTPMPPLTPGERPLHDSDVLVVLEEGLEVELESAVEVGLERISEVAVATFQPLNGMALMKVEDRTASVVRFIPVAKEAKNVMVWPGINGDWQSPTALPGCPF